MEEIVFPRLVLETYTGKDSWVVARRIAEVTGFSTVALYPAGTTKYNENFLHMGVRLPDGKILDVNGTYDDKEFKAAYTAGAELEIYEVPDEKTYYLLTDELFPSRMVPYELKKIISSMFEKYVPSLLYRLKAL